MRWLPVKGSAWPFLDPVEPPAGTAQGPEPEILQASERLVTSMFADVRGYAALTSVTPPADMVERMTTLYRWTAAEVRRHHGFVDKFAGDAVMATFNTTGQRLDHARDALEAALALSGSAALLDLGLGSGISVGPAVIGPTVGDGNVSVVGATTNLAARLQTQERARSCSATKRTGGSSIGSVNTGSRRAQKRSSSKASAGRSGRGGCEPAHLPAARQPGLRLDAPQIGRRPKVDPRPAERGK